MARKLIKFFVSVLVIGVIFYLLSWGLNAISLPNPFAYIGRIVVIAAAILALINAILQLFDKAFINW